jgi:hypothetical protein
MEQTSTPQLQIFDNQGNPVSFLAAPDTVFEGPFTAKVWNQEKGSYDQHTADTIEDCFSEEIATVLGRNLASIK